MKEKICTCLALLFLSSCAHNCPPSPAIEASSLQGEWQESQNYYALYELIDKHFANRPARSAPTKDEVMEILGRPNWGTVRQDENTIAYQGRGRHVPYQDKVLFAFDAKNRLMSIDWLSE